ncbi:MAG: ABC transporter ATP-binding protein [Desulfobacterales bacterium]|jgi:branched-chain amino acid transport system ATP-binding protein|nr:ABC transporter ATP-binding protein [Desulfobacterales bacterium]
MTEPILLEVKEVSRSFGKFQALRQVSLEIRAGRLCALIGPNGAGKTTFYNVVSGRYRPTGGRVFFEGQDITQAPAHRRVEMGLLRSFQITNIFPALTVLENVLVPLVVQHGKSFACLGSIAKRRDMAEEAEQILSRVGLTGQSHRVVSTLAYGDKRLIEIAIVLARRPRLVLLDEPTAGMNPEETDRMIRLVKELSERSETTFFITEHDMKVVFSVAERIFVLNQGSLLADGTPDEIRANPEVKRAYLGGSLDAAGL